VELDGSAVRRVAVADNPAAVLQPVDDAGDRRADGVRGYQRALMVGSAFVLAAGAVALLARNTRETASVAEDEPVLELAA
jgi:hypothetical protein